MRVLAYSNKELSLNLDKTLTQYVFTDSSTDIGEVEYASYIRRYDLIYIHISNNERIKSFAETFKYLNKIDDFSFNLNIICDSEERIVEVKKIIKSIYKNLSPRFLLTETGISPFISSEITKTFYQAPEVIKKLNIDINNRIISIDVGDGLITIDMSKKEDKKNFQLLLFFIRHYGETINISTILSGTTKEPELASFSPIEGAISSIRKMFESIFDVPLSIKSVKKVGYEFNLKVI